MFYDLKVDTYLTDNVVAGIDRSGSRAEINSVVKARQGVSPSPPPRGVTWRDPLTQTHIKTKREAGTFQSVYAPISDCAASSPADPAFGSAHRRAHGAGPDLYELRCLART